jgi:hypothetical protein
MVSLGGFGFAVHVKTDCPHVALLGVKEIAREDAARILASSCESCGMWRGVEGGKWMVECVGRAIVR